MNCDMSASWKGLDKGGAAKIATCFCHCCDCTSDKLVIPNVNLCEIRCNKLHKDKNNWKCQHKDVLK